MVRNGMKKSRKRQKEETTSGMVIRAAMVCFVCVTFSSQVRSAEGAAEQLRFTEGRKKRSIFKNLIVLRPVGFETRFYKAKSWPVVCPMSYRVMCPVWVIDQNIGFARTAKGARCAKVESGRSRKSKMHKDGSRRLAMTNEVQISSHTVKNRLDQFT
jgi:hypothetical protein